MAVWQTLKSAIVGVGVGEATADALTPILTPAAQDAWAKNPYKALAASIAAELVAQGLTDATTGAAEASLTGIGADRFTAMIQAALTAPGVPEGLTLLRRTAIEPGDFTHILRKNMLEPAWDAALTSLKDDRLSPQVIALAIVRGLVKDPGILPVPPPTGVGKVAAFPVFDIDALTEAMASGYDEIRLAVLVGINGRPASPQEAANAMWRGAATIDDYYRAISEGDVRNEWRDVLLAAFAQIPTSHDFVEMRLRNYFTTDQEMYDGTAKHGMTPGDTDILFKVTGRPLSWHQTWTGTQRGGTLGGPIDDIDPAFLDSLRKSNIRPEYYNLAWADRNPVPAPFMVRQWLKDGGDVAQARTWLTDQGWLTPDIDAVVTEYAGKGTASASSHVKSAATAAVTAIKKRYLTGSLPPADATTLLTQAGETAANAAAILAQWDIIAQVEGVNIDTVGGTPH